MPPPTYKTDEAAPQAGQKSQEVESTNPEPYLACEDFIASRVYTTFTDSAAEFNTPVLVS